MRHRAAQHLAATRRQCLQIPRLLAAHMQAHNSSSKRSYSAMMAATVNEDTGQPATQKGQPVQPLNQAHTLVQAPPAAGLASCPDVISSNSCVPTLPSNQHSQPGSSGTAAGGPHTSATQVADAQPAVTTPCPPASHQGPPERVIEPIHPDALLIPPPSTSLRARVEHFTCPQEGSLLPVLSQLLNCDQAFVERLVWFGAVYYCPVMPLPGGGKGGIVPLHLQQGSDGSNRLAAVREEGLKRWGAGTDKSTPRRVSDVYMPVHKSGYLRAHVYPKRFPAVYQVPDWRLRVLCTTPHFVAVDKPAGVQVPPTVDNIRESLICQVEQVLGLPESSLTPPHRLDAGTSGVVILSRTPAFSRHFQAMLRDKTNNLNGPAGPQGGGEPQGGHQGGGRGTQGGDSQLPEGVVRKTYRCVSHMQAGPPPVGRMSHWVEQNVRVIGLPEYTRVVPGPTACPTAKYCELIVLKVERVQLCGAAAERWGPEAWESTIQLVTGRTHQIRVQLAAAGQPLLGDVLYGYLKDSGALMAGADSSSNPASAQQHNDASRDAAAVPESGGVSGFKATGTHQSTAALMDQVSALEPVGLQAWRMEVPADDTFFKPGSTCFTAGDPWWRSRSST